MTVVKSIAIGKARGSAGNVTYRVVRGRTIMSEKVGTRPATRLPSGAQAQRTMVFGLLARFARMHSLSIKASFNKTRYGSERNYFMKLNYGVLFQPLLDLATAAGDPNRVTDAEIDNAVTAYATANPNSVVRISLAGQDRVYLNGAWISVDDPIGPPEPGSPVVNSIGVNGTSSAFQPGGVLSVNKQAVDQGDGTFAMSIVCTGENLNKVSDVQVYRNGAWANADTPSISPTRIELFELGATSFDIAGVRYTYSGNQTVLAFL